MALFFHVLCVHGKPCTYTCIDSYAFTRLRPHRLHCQFNNSISIKHQNSAVNTDKHLNISYCCYCFVGERFWIILMLHFLMFGRAVSSLFHLLLRTINFVFFCFFRQTLLAAAPVSENVLYTRIVFPGCFFFAIKIDVANYGIFTNKFHVLRFAIKVLQKQLIIWIIKNIRKQIKFDLIKEWILNWKREKLNFVFSQSF